MTPHEEALALVRDWLGYHSRFGVVEEIIEGAVTEEDVVSVARAFLAASREIERMRAVCEAAKAFRPKLDGLRQQFPPPDIWFADATCTARVEFTVEQWNKLEALRKALDALAQPTTSEGES